jgi:hypothetical protein
MEKPRMLINKSFFGKGNCFKFLLYDNGNVLFHFGVEGKEWKWKKVKMNDSELGEILLVLEGRKDSVSFFHSFGEGPSKKTTQIWINKKEENFFIRVKERSRKFDRTFCC